IRAPHVTALAGKAIAEHFYGERPRKSYFMGCSGGGHQGMHEAQVFPWDFDGIIANAPALRSDAGVGFNALWAIRALTGRKGEVLLKADDVEVLHRAVVARCDMNDGLRDGLIGDPRACRFDPGELSCATGKRDRCLTAEQIAAVEKIYLGPRTSR